MPIRSCKSSPCQGTAILSSDPPGQLPKLFKPSQMAMISLNPVRDHVHNRNISFSGVRQMMLWQHSSYRIAISPSSGAALDHTAVMPASTSPKSQRSSAGSQQLVPGNPCLQALIFPAAVVEMQVGHSAPWLPLELSWNMATTPICAC